MNKIIIISSIVVVVLAIVFVFFITSGPNLKQYQYLKQPQIRTMPTQKMIVVELNGDPNTTAGKAIGQLYGVFYSLKDNKVKQAAPRARWPVSLETAKSEWVGVYGLPVSETVTELPPKKNNAGLKITAWEYGTVAEILHIGAYSEEVPTIERLKQFIADNGYEIIGDHEEEYLKGPGLFPTNPKNYYTIIRYRVQKKQ